MSVSTAGCFWSHAKPVLDPEPCKAENTFMHLVSVHFPACPTPLTLPWCQTKPTSSHLCTLKLISLTGQSAYFPCSPVSSCPTSRFHFFEIMERFVNQGDYSASAGGHEQASRVAGWLGKKASIKFKRTLLFLCRILIILSALSLCASSFRHFEKNTSILTASTEVVSQYQTVICF